MKKLIEVTFVVSLVVLDYLVSIICRISIYGIIPFKSRRSKKS